MSDTTAEGLKATVMLQSLPFIQPVIGEKNLCDSADLLIGMQNSDGGFGSYELIRATQLLEGINAAEVFGKIMTEYS